MGMMGKVGAALSRHWAYEYAIGLAVVAACTAIGMALYPHLNAASIANLYVLSVALTALRSGRGPAVLASVASVLLLDYLFIPPRFSFDVADPSNYLTLIVMCCVALITAQLVSRLRRERSLAQAREQRAAMLAEEVLRLAESAEQARAAGERATLCNTLLSSISHDLRSPLAAIAGAGSLIARASADAARLASLGELIEERARAMATLVGRILQLAKLELGELRLETDWQSVDDLVAHSLRMSSAPLSEHVVTVELGGDLPLIEVEATLIVQLLSNLLENAGKYTPSGSRIRVSAEESGDWMVIAVADDGPGIGDVAGLFERFKRGEKTRGSGFGLGLAICRTVARLHGGELSAGVDTTLGGARFELCLPLPREPSRGELAAKLEEAQGERDELVAGVA